MNTLLAISIAINLAIIVSVTYFFKKYDSLRFLFKKDTTLEYESIFTSVFEYAPYSIVIQRIDNGACVAANQAFLKSMGISKDDLLHLNMNSRLNMTPEEANNARQYVAKIGGLYAQEAVIQKEPGIDTHVLYSSMPIIFKKIPCIISITIDITKQKKAIKALSESEQKFSSVFLHSPLGIMLTSSNGHLEEVNPELLKMLGHANREDLFASPDQIRELESIFLNCKQMHDQDQQKYLQREIHLTRKDGTQIDAILRLSTQHDCAENRWIVLLEDVSARKAQETELKAWATRFEIVNIAAQHVFYDYDLTNETAQWEGAVKKMLGIELNEINGSIDLWKELLHPHDTPYVIAQLNESRAACSKFDTVYRMRHKKGHYIYVHDCGFFQQDYNGKPTQMLGILQDITATKHSELALKANEIKYRTLFESAQDTILLMDGPTIVDCNPSTSALIGLPREQIIGHTPAEFSPPVQDNDKTTTDLMYDVIQQVDQGQSPQYEWLCRHSNGSIIPVETSLTTMQLTDKKYLLAFVRNISDRREAEIQLKLSEEKFFNVFNLAPYSISIARIEDSVILDVNNAFEVLTGYTREEAVGKSGDALRLWNDPAARASYVSKVLKDACVVDYEFAMRRKDGGLRTALNSCQCLEINGSLCTLNIVRDITDRTILQQAMAQAEKMMSLGGLASGMAHEINNPLGIISQSVQGIQRRFSADLQANITEAERLNIDINKLHEYMQSRNINKYLNGISEAVNRAASIVKSMLNFSHRSESVLVAGNIKKIIAQAVNLAMQDYDLNNTYDFSKIDIQLDLAEQLDSIPCNPSEIEQVILNILRNAAHALDAYGTKSPTITIKTSITEQDALIEISDNGPGMTEEQLSKIFDPFYTTKHNSGGTGLGLSISYFIVTVTHRGRIRAVSTPPNGACFQIYLPLVQKQ